MEIKCDQLKCMCRTCLKLINNTLNSSSPIFDNNTTIIYENLTSIFNYINVNSMQIQIIEMMLNCSNVQILKNDIFPKQICSECLQKLQFTYEFRKQIENSDVILKSMLIEQQSSSSSSIIPEPPTTPSTLLINEIQEYNSILSSSFDNHHNYCNSMNTTNYDMNLINNNNNTFNENTMYLSHLNNTHHSNNNSSTVRQIENNIILPMETHLNSNIEMPFITTEEINNIIIQHNAETQHNPRMVIDNPIEMLYENQENHYISVQPTTHSMMTVPNSNNNNNNNDLFLLSATSLNVNNGITELPWHPMDNNNESNTQQWNTIQSSSTATLISDQAINTQTIKFEQCDCVVCKKNFPNDILLQRHLHTKHYVRTNENVYKPYKCDICDKVYSSYTNLSRHRVTHIWLLPLHLVVLATIAVDTALVVDIGHLEANVIPVYCGVQINSAYDAQPLASQAVHNEIRRQLIAENIQTTDLLTDRIIEDIKVRLCFVTTYERAQQYRNNMPPTPCPDCDYPINGKQIIKISGRLRETVFEVLFPDDNDNLSLPNIILNAILKCPIDTRTQLLENILLIGGTTMTMGLQARLKSELLTLMESNQYNEKLFVTTEELVKFHSAPAKPNFTAWLGGSIYGGTKLTHSRCLTKESFAKNNRVPDWINFLDNCSPITEQ